MAISTPDAQQPEQPRCQTRRARYEVLWVDDDPNLTAAYARRLLRRGFHIVPASDGMQGYWQTLTSPPDVIVTDLKMPRWEGQELLNSLCQNSATSFIPTVVLSGYAGEFRENGLPAANIVAVLQKPVAFPVLEAVLRRAVS